MWQVCVKNRKCMFLCWVTASNSDMLCRPFFYVFVFAIENVSEFHVLREQADDDELKVK